MTVDLVFTLGSAQREGLLSYRSLNVRGIDQIFLYVFDIQGHEHVSKMLLFLEGHHLWYKTV